MGDEIYLRNQKDNAQKVFDELDTMEQYLQWIVDLIETSENREMYLDEIKDLRIRVLNDKDEAEKEKDRLQDLIYKLDSWEDDEQERNQEYREMQGV